MRASWRYLFLSCAALAAACGSSAEQPELTAAALPGPQQTPTSDAGATSLAFDAPSVLQLVSGETRAVRVVVSPAGLWSVRFALLGDSLEASLDHDIVLTTAHGVASALLTAPLDATTFRIRASIDDGPSVEQAVSVSSDGFASVFVRPLYAGRRQPASWTAFAATRRTCASLTDQSDGLVSSTVPAGSAAELPSLPVGPSIAVTLKAGRSVAGCADVLDLRPGERREMTVTVTDNPIDLASTDLPLRVLLKPDGSALSPLIASAAAEFLDGFLDGADTDTEALLDAMREASPEPPAFQAARMAAGWDSIVDEALDSSLSETLSSWMQKGAASVLEGEAFAGRLRALNASEALLNIQSVAGLEPAAAGIDDQVAFSMSEAPSDIVHLGTSLSWYASRLAGGLIQKGAAQNGPDAIVSLINCDKLGSVLAATLDDSSTCSNDCLAQACADAAVRMWDRALSQSASKGETVTATITISAEATVNDQAQIDALQGTWAGSVHVSTRGVSIRGDVTSR